MDLGYRTQDPGSEIRKKNLFRIPDPEVKKAPDSRIRNTVLIYTFYEFLCLKIIEFIAGYYS